MFGQEKHYKNNLNMKKNISEIVSKELGRKYQLNETWKKIMLDEEDKRFFNCINYLDGLIKEGYTNEMLENEINEVWGFDWLKNLWNSDRATPAQATMSDVRGKSQGGLISQFKEYIISSLLKLLGFKGPLAEAISTALSEMRIGDLVAVFRGQTSCTRHGATIADALSEAIVTYILQATEGNSMAYNFIKNTVFEYVKGSQWGETAAKFICNAAYGAKQKMIAQTSQTSQGSQPQQKPSALG